MIRSQTESFTSPSYQVGEGLEWRHITALYYTQTKTLNSDYLPWLFIDWHNYLFSSVPVSEARLLMA